MTEKGGARGARIAPIGVLAWSRPGATHLWHCRRDVEASYLKEEARLGVVYCRLSVHHVPPGPMGKVTFFSGSSALA